MKIAVMQPYFFPYLGYYQLAAGVDNFIFFDDVSYIKKGYINRNAILAAGQSCRFSLPVVNQSQNRAINQHDYVGNYQPFLQLIRQSYQTAPYFDAVMPMILQVINLPTRNVAAVNACSISSVFSYLSLPFKWRFSSDFSNEKQLKASDRIIDLCLRSEALCYHNASGGRALYADEDFSRQGLSLLFCQPTLSAYLQQGEEFVAGLSIIDMLMFCSPQTCREHLTAGKLLTASEM
ncbi:WbqC family protein [Pantoea sp. BAV 3049]|uniref:WbqC family protein n=1 Tax=Pantoea sp. BAV 3049 TaxID=2654188 RepID=UPI00131D64C9|nr:WbqC family protein [Pantoea sp. BAV 3049]